MISKPNVERPPTSTPARSSSTPFPRYANSNDSTGIRSFIASDLDQVTSLWMRCFRNERSPAPEGFKRYFREVLLENPWFQPDLAPLVLEQHGEIVGFIGRMARPMSFQGEPLRCVVATQLMVDPDRKLGFAVIELVRALHNGPQDLCYSDGANDQSLRIWQRCGGEASRLFSFEWLRPLRPARTFTSSLREHPRLGRIARILRPGASALDAITVNLLPRFYHKPQRSLHRRESTAAEIFPLLQQVCIQSPLHPVYTPSAYSWLLSKAAEAKQFGPLRAIIVHDHDGRPLGWFIYMVKPGEVARVLQLGAIPAAGESIISELFRDAWEQRAAAVTGQLDPSLLTELSNSHCHFRCASLDVLVHSRNLALLNALHRGEAFLSRLDGEWWLRFGIDRLGTW